MFDLILIDSIKIQSARRFSYSIVCLCVNKIDLKDRKILGSFLRAENAEAEEGDRYTNHIWCSWKCFQDLGEKVMEWLEIHGRHETTQILLLRSAWILRRVLEIYCHSDSREKLSIKIWMEIRIKNEKRPEDLRRFVTQTPLRSHRLTLVWKSLTKE